MNLQCGGFGAPGFEPGSARVEQKPGQVVGKTVMSKSFLAVAATGAVFSPVRRRAGAPGARRRAHAGNPAAAVPRLAARPSRRPPVPADRLRHGASSGGDHRRPADRRLGRAGQGLPGQRMARPLPRAKPTGARRATAERRATAPSTSASAKPSKPALCRRGRLLRRTDVREAKPPSYRRLRPVLLQTALDWAY